MAICLLAAACGGTAGDRAATPSPTPQSLETPVTPSTGTDDPAERDLVDLALRLGGLSRPPSPVRLPPPSIGDVQEFELLVLSRDPDELPERRTSAAVLLAVSEHAYFYVEQGTGVGEAEAQAAAQALEQDVWPAVVGAFGAPPSPGIDGDPRIVIIHADLGRAVGGYVSGEDAYPSEAVPLSNQREIVYLNLSLGSIGGETYKQVLAHELQHLIHGGLDVGEEAWLNEGLSVFAAGLVGDREAPYGAYLDEPDTQLNTWSDVGSSGEHYGAAGLFVEYLLEQTGGAAGQLAAEPADGIEGVRAFLQATGSSRSLEELAGDWTVANYLDQPEGPYGYSEVEVGGPETVRIEGPEEADAQVSQFAADYLELEAEDFSPSPVFQFQGATEVSVLGAQSSGEVGSFWWSNRGDNIDSMLTRELDLTGVQQATLTFRTWYDIERWYDYGYVVVSSDGGSTWDVLSGEETTNDDPLDVAYGPGFTGRSGADDEAEWVDERIDLSAYAGTRILLRFELVNDESQNRPGWAIDDIAVQEIGFFDDGESDVGDWHRAGFRRVTEPLDQRFELRLITLGAAPAVKAIALDGQNRARIALDGLGTEYNQAVIIVMGTTEGTTERARYRFDVTEPP